LLLGFSIVSLCAAQSQTGNASYNPSKTGLRISHSSLSFNTRVRVTNLQNNRSVEAVVDGRIPITNERIADISREAGDALEMNKNGMTLVKIEELPPRTRQAPVPAETPVQEASPAPPPAVVTVVPVPQDPPPPQILPVQTITDIQYVPVPAAPSCTPYCLPLIVGLLVLLILLLALLLVLLLRRFPLWPWYYPFWLRRYYHRYKGQQRNR
jgi:hypothetical protein